MISTTVFDLSDLDTARTNRSIIEELSTELVNGFPEKYSKPGKPFVLGHLTRTTRTFKGERRYSAQKGIEASIYRFGNQVALGLCGTNDFSRDCADEGISSRPDFLKWRHAHGALSWKQHLEIVQEAILDLEEVGYLLPHIQTKGFSALEFSVFDQERSYGPAAFRASSMLKCPLQKASVDEITISRIGGIPSRSKMRLPDFPGQVAGLFNRPPAIRASGAAQGSGNIILIPSAADQGDLAVLIRKIETLELKGTKFQLMQEESLFNRFSWPNALFSIAMKSGCQPWSTTMHNDGPRIALDAGHDPARRASRWAMSQYGCKAGELEISHFDGRLKENIEGDVLRAFSSTSPAQNEIWRDGRLHKRDAAAISRALSGSRIFEIIKSANLILFRGDINAPTPPRTGDCVILNECNTIIQTQNAKVSESYRRPLQARGEIDQKWCTDFVSLAFRPTRSIYNLSSLPAPLYFADRASKLSTSGWLSAVGNGWHLPAPL